MVLQCRLVFQRHRPQLKRLFTSYAAADRSKGAFAHTDTINIHEFLQLLRVRSAQCCWCREMNMHTRTHAHTDADLDFFRRVVRASVVL